MADSRDFSNAAEEMSTTYAHYVLRSAVASAHTIHLFDQVISCVARRQVTPETLHDSLTRFALAHASKSGANVSTAAARFVAGLASSAFLPASDDDPPVDVDPSNPSGSFARIGERALERNARAVEANVAQLAAVAAGEMKANEFRRATTKQLNHMVANEFTRAGRIWFDLLGALDEERGRLAEHYLMGVLRAVDPIGFDADVVELAGPVNTRISTIVTVDNTRSERAVIRCGVGDVRRADGVGPAFLPDLVLDPAHLVLEREREANVNLSLWLDGAIYDANTPYVGTFHISRDDAPRLDVPLRITPNGKTS